MSFFTASEKILKSKYLVPSAILLNIILHLPFINTAPHSVHVWRQCNTLAVARNFYEEDMNLFNTRVDNRGNSPGITGSHFPFYEYILAVFYKVFGEKFWIHRVFSLITFIWGGLGLMLLINEISKNRSAGKIGIIGWLFSPELFYHEISALPDILALSLSVWGFYYFVRWTKQLIENRDSINHFYYLLAVLTTVLAGLTKLQYLAIGFPIAIFFFMQYTRMRLNIWILVSIYGLLSVLIPLYWYYRATQLIKSSGLSDFGIELRPETDFLKGVQILTDNIISWLPETILNFASFSLLIIGLFYFFRKKHFTNPWLIPFLAYAVILLFYHLIELRQMEHHGYYMMPYYILLLAIVSYGGTQLLNENRFAILFVLIVLQPIFASFRIFPSRWLKENKGVPDYFFDEKKRNILVTAAPPKDLAIVGPDESNCIMFYFLHKKGFGFTNASDLLSRNSSGTPLIEDYITKGAKYLYIKDEEKNQIGQFYSYTEKELMHMDDLYVLKLKKLENIHTADIEK